MPEVDMDLVVMDVKRVIKGYTGIPLKRMGPKSRLGDGGLGICYHDRVQLLNDIEKKFGIKVPSCVVDSSSFGDGEYSAATVGQLAKYVVRQMDRQGSQKLKDYLSAEEGL